jgi:hypothetical protein
LLDISAVERDMPSSWTEERVLLEKISNAGAKYTKENPIKTELEKNVAITEKDTENKNVASSRQGDLNPATKNYKDPVNGDRYVMLSVVPGTVPAATLSVVRVDPATVEDIAELQAIILHRLSASDAVAWYFRCGQTLAKLQAQIGDDSRSVVVIEELRNLAFQLAPTHKLRIGLEEVVKMADIVKIEPAKKADLEVMIMKLRNSL